MLTRELRNGGSASSIYNMCFRAGATQRAACTQQTFEVCIVGAVRFSALSDLQQLRKVRQDGDFRVLDGAERPLLAASEAQCSLPQIVAYAEQDFRLAH